MFRLTDNLIACVFTRRSKQHPTLKQIGVSVYNCLLRKFTNELFLEATAIQPMNWDYHAPSDALYISYCAQDKQMLETTRIARVTGLVCQTKQRIEHWLTPVMDQPNARLVGCVKGLVIASDYKFDYYPYLEGSTGVAVHTIWQTSNKNPFSTVQPSIKIDDEFITVNNLNEDGEIHNSIRFSRNNPIVGVTITEDTPVKESKHHLFIVGDHELNTSDKGQLVDQKGTRVLIDEKLEDRLEDRSSIICSLNHGMGGRLFVVFRSASCGVVELVIVERLVRMKKRRRGDDDEEDEEAM